MSDSVIGNLLKDFLISDQGKPYAECDQQIARDAITALALFIDNRVDDRGIFIARDQRDEKGALVYSYRPVIYSGLYTAPVIGCVIDPLGLNRGEVASILIIKQ